MTSTDTLSDIERAYLLRAVELAGLARAHGNHPFGAVLVTAEGRVIESENTVLTAHDPTGHAETNLVRSAASVLSDAELLSSELYTSTEPCAMCAGAIYWAGIGRVVFALSESALAELTSMNARNSEKPAEPTMSLPCREVFARGVREIRVDGPFALQEAVDVHLGFWQ